ncbi:PEP-CTERM putative exosortase interaction domain-containing protein [Opitutaceae bacterium TAV1]|nr:PEP-CTERM putative exosortase interaction domain-containing protein [Opitutaceae bacterium TAV1]
MHINTHSSILRFASLAAPLFLGAATLNALVLQLDFGPTAATGDALTNSPYHTVNDTFIGSAWNTIGLTDIAAGALVWADGTTATGVSLNLGASTSANTTTVALATQPSTNLAGTGVTTGIYADTSVGRDAIFSGTATGQTRYAGFVLEGLSAGTYEIYTIARNTNYTTSAYTQTVYAGALASGTTSFDVPTTLALTGTSGTLSYLANNATTFVSTWIDGENYVKFTVTLAEGECLALAVIGGGGDNRGFLNSVQIVASAVPEPATVALLAGLGVLATVIVFRRRS